MPSTRRKKLASKKMDKAARTLQQVSETVAESMEETKPAADDQTTYEVQLAKASIEEGCKTPFETSETKGEEQQEEVIASAPAAHSTSLMSRRSLLQLRLPTAPHMPQRQQAENCNAHLTPPSMPIEVQVLTRTSIAKLVANTCESANLAMKLMEKYPLTYDDKVNSMSLDEIRRIDSEFVFTKLLAMDCHCTTLSTD